VAQVSLLTQEKQVVPAGQSKKLPSVIPMSPESTLISSGNVLIRLYRRMFGW
jgi:hypothetical protein